MSQKMRGHQLFSRKKMNSEKVLTLFLEVLVYPFIRFQFHPKGGTLSINSIHVIGKNNIFQRIDNQINISKSRLCLEALRSSIQNNIPWINKYDFTVREWQIQHQIIYFCPHSSLLKVRGFNYSLFQWYWG